MAEERKQGQIDVLLQQAPTQPSAHQTRQLNWASESTQAQAHAHRHTGNKEQIKSNEN